MIAQCWPLCASPIDAIAQSPPQFTSCTIPVVRVGRMFDRSSHLCRDPAACLPRLHVVIGTNEELFWRCNARVRSRSIDTELPSRRLVCEEQLDRGARSLGRAAGCGLRGEKSCPASCDCTRAPFFNLAKTRCWAGAQTSAAGVTRRVVSATRRRIHRCNPRTKRTPARGLLRIFSCGRIAD